MKTVKGTGAFARFAALFWVALCALCFATPAGALNDALAARYMFCDTLFESGGGPAARLYCYDKKDYIDPENAEFFTDAGEGGVFNVPCISLAGAGMSGQGRYAVTLPAGLMPRGTSELTISLWYKSAEAADSVKLMAFGNSMASLEFLLSGIVRCNGSIIAQASRPYCQNKWLHLCFVISGRTVRIYIDGAESKAADPVEASRELASIVNQGGSLGDGTFLDGALANSGLFSDVRIYKRALGEQEIKALSDGGRNGLLITSTDSRCVFDKAASYDVREYRATAESGTGSLTVNVAGGDPNGALSVSGGAKVSGSCPFTVNLPLSAGENRFTLSFVSLNGRSSQYLLTVICPPAAPSFSGASSVASKSLPSGHSDGGTIPSNGAYPSRGDEYSSRWSGAQSGAYSDVSPSANTVSSAHLPEQAERYTTSRRVLTVSDFSRGRLLAAFGAPAVLAASCAGVVLANRRKNKR